MKRTTSKTIFTVVFAGFLALGSGLALAQEKPADTMQLVRERIGADKKLLIATDMGLTESEAKAFWPVYESYQAELAKIEDRTGRLIEEYARNYRAMSNEEAKKLLDEFLAIEADRAKGQVAQAEAELGKTEIDVKRSKKSGPNRPVLSVPWRML